jgi:hypothetical protein
MFWAAASHPEVVKLQRLAEDLARVYNYHERANGIDLSRRVAAAILALAPRRSRSMPAARYPRLMAT